VVVQKFASEQATVRANFGIGTLVSVPVLTFANESAAKGRER